MIETNKRLFLVYYATYNQVNSFNKNAGAGKKRQRERIGGTDVGSRFASQLGGRSRGGRGGERGRASHLLRVEDDGHCARILSGVLLAIQPRNRGCQDSAGPHLISSIFAPHTSKIPARVGRVWGHSPLSLVIHQPITSPCQARYQPGVVLG